MAASNVWTDVETEALVNLWSEGNIQDALENYSIRNNVVYGKLSASLWDLDIIRSAKQICSKLKHLCEKYRDYSDKIAKSGAGGSKPPKFFDEMDAILRPRPQTRHLFVLDSGKPNTDDHDSGRSEDEDQYGGNISTSSSELNGSDIINDIYIYINIYI